MEMKDIKKITEKGWTVGMPSTIGNVEIWTTDYDLSEAIRSYWDSLASHPDKRV